MSAHLSVAALNEVQQLKHSLEDWVRRIQVATQTPVEESLLRAAFEDNPVALSLSTLHEGKMLRVNREWLRISGYTSQEVLGRRVNELGLWPDLVARQAAVDQIYRHGRIDDVEAHLVFKDGPKPVRWSGVMLVLNGQQHLLVSLQDLSREKALGASLAEQVELIHRVTEHTASMLFHVRQAAPEGLCMPYVSPAVQTLIGVPPEALRDNLNALMAKVHPQDQEALRESIREVMHPGALWRHAFRVVHEDGRVLWLEGEATIYAQAEGGLHAYGALTDISERKRHEEKNQRQAFYDQLTDLPNRRLMLDRIRQAQIASGRSNRHAALMFLDLDNFKTVNDNLGHDVGDQLLIEVAQRLSATVREGDTAARFGGDEFVVMIEDLSDHEGAAVYQAEQVGMKILARLNETITLAGMPHASPGSIGVVLFRGQQTSLDELLKRADMAMYQAKSAGRNTLQFFESSMQESIQARAALRAEIELAIDNQQFALHYQPMFDRHKQILGFEAYVRWNHPERGLLPAREFIDMAQRNPLINLINDWALRAACEQLGIWAQQPATAHLNLSVNISPCGLEHPDFTGHVVQILRETGANPYRLTLEFKEIQPGDEGQLLEKMRALREIGVRFALDDFGTGFTPLSLLKRLPLSHLKISRSFVQNLSRNPDDASMVRTILALAQNLDLMAMIEGVETFEQYDKLSAFGCEQFQGYLFGRPEPLSHWGLTSDPDAQLDVGLHNQAA